MASCSIFIVQLLGVVGFVYSAPAEPAPEILSITSSNNVTKFHIEPPNQPILTPRRQSSCENVKYTFPNIGKTAKLLSISNPNSYPNGLDCSWFMTSPVGSRIKIECSEFYVPCQQDYMYFSLSGSPTFVDATIGYCGNGAKFTETSKENSLSVGFKSSESPSSYEKYQRKYTCRFTVIPGDTSTSSSGNGTPSPTPELANPSSPSQGNCKCGEQFPTTRIVGGTEASAGEFPWRVMVHQSDGYFVGSICGGTIINENWVLTAAHCTMRYQPGFKMYVFYNTTTNPVVSGRAGVTQRIEADRFVQHTGYTTTRLENDLSLIHLSKPIKFGRNVGPICLPYSLTSETWEDKRVTASGFGTTEPVPINTGNTDRPSPILRKVTLPTMSTARCKTHYGAKRITENMFCTLIPGQDSCQGDSGGSIDYYNPINGLWYLAGVTSFGAGCAQAKYPGVYVKVANYLKWIEQNTGESFCSR